MRSRIAGALREFGSGTRHAEVRGRKAMQSPAVRTPPGLAGLALAPGLALSAHPARAQTAGATVAAIQQPYPERWLNYGQPNQQDKTVSTRPINMNPYGISYDDCIEDMTLVFSVYLSGFTGSQSMQIWA